MLSATRGSAISLHFQVIMYLLEGPGRSTADLFREFLLGDNGQALLGLTVAMRMKAVERVKSYNPKMK